LYSELIELEPNNEGRIKENIKNIKAATASATALTRQLLLFSRKQMSNAEILDVNELLQNLERMLRRLIGENIKIQTRLAGDLKNVRLDPSQLEQVVLNLVVNARDAMPSGGTIILETKNVYLDADSKNYLLPVNAGEYVCLSVTDTGEGMDTATQSKIFEPFFTTKESGKGTGLGLSTTFGIVKQNEGTLWLYSEPGHGSIFKIYFPVNKDAAGSLESSMEIPRVPLAAGTETILLVEDSESLKKGFVSVLEAKGYTVLAASSGEEALAISENFDQGPIHLMLTDMVMPGMDGLELTKKIREKRKDIRVLYMSGYTNDSLKNRGEAVLQEAEFLQKPFGVSELLTKIKSVLKA
jgi:CheY-like chemotaxis protein